jgi:uncharacterized protein YjbI with pentapeptide repeats
LGRYTLNDLVSKDKEDWLSIRQCPELIPDVLKGDPHDENRNERIKAARRWADERRGERREDADPARTGPGRREPESLTTAEYRQQREQVSSEIRPRRDKSLLGLGLVIILIVGGVIAAFQLPPPEVEEAQCNSPARAKINWQNCQLVGLQSINSNLSESQLSNANLESANLLGSNFQKADVSYANLKNANLSFVEFQNARMLGADLHGADLTNADLTNADLSYANLQGAKIKNTNFTGAILSNVIWVDGRKCVSPSIGKCK